MNTPRDARYRVCLTAILLAAVPLHGQLAEQDDVVRLDPFTVSSENDRGYQASESISGSRFVTELKNAPFMLDVLPSRLLEEINPVKMEDILNYSTGTTSNMAIFQDGPTMFQRGFQTFLYLRDGIRHNGSFDQAAVERIEVVKGPSSVLFGIANPGGTVNYIAKKPLAKRQTMIEQTVGRWNTIRTVFDTGGPLTDNASIKYRMPVSFHKSDRPRKYNEKEQFFAAPVVSWQMTPKTSVEASFEYLKSNEVPYGSTPAIIIEAWGWPTFLPRDWTPQTPEHFGHAEYGLGSLVVKHALNQDWLIRSTTGFSKRDYNLHQAIRGATRLPDLLGFRQSQHRDITDVMFQSNTDLIGTMKVGKSKLTVVAGLELRDDYNTFVVRDGFLGFTPPAWKLKDPSTWDYTEKVFDRLGLRSSSNTKFQSTAYSAMGQLEAADGRFFLVGGFRHDSTESTFINRVDGKVQVFDPSQGSVQAGALFRLRPNLAVYANHSTSFEPLLRPLIDANQKPFNPVPIEGVGYEVGLKQELAGGKFQHSIAAYQITQKNNVVILLQQVGSGISQSYNVQSGEQESTGVEYSFNAVVNDNFAFFGGYAYNDAEVTKDAGAPATVGHRLGNSFHNKWNVYGQYRFSTGALKNVSLGLGYVYVGNAPYAVGLLNSLIIPEHTLVNLSVGYNWNVGNYKWSAQLNLDNALDEDYYNFSNYRGDPRDIRFTVRVRF